VTFGSDLPLKQNRALLQAPTTSVNAQGRFVAASRLGGLPTVKQRRRLPQTGRAQYAMPSRNSTDTDSRASMRRSGSIGPGYAAHYEKPIRIDGQTEGTADLTATLKALPIPGHRRPHGHTEGPAEPKPRPFQSSRGLDSATAAGPDRAECDRDPSLGQSHVRRLYRSSAPDSGRHGSTRQSRAGLKTPWVVAHRGRPQRKRACASSRHHKSRTTARHANARSQPPTTEKACASGRHDKLDPSA
jgi:hypothetical protein